MEGPSWSQPDIRTTTLVVCFLRAVLCLRRLLSRLGVLRVEERVGNTLAFWLRSRLDQIQNPTLPEAAQVGSTVWSLAAGLILALSVSSCVTLGKLLNLSLGLLTFPMGMA